MFSYDDSLVWSLSPRDIIFFMKRFTIVATFMFNWWFHFGLSYFEAFSVRVCIFIFESVISRGYSWQSSWGKLNIILLFILKYDVLQPCQHGNTIKLEQLHHHFTVLRTLGRGTKSVKIIRITTKEIRCYFDLISNKYTKPIVVMARRFS